MAITEVQFVTDGGANSPQTLTLGANATPGNWLIGGFQGYPASYYITSIVGNGTWVQDCINNDASVGDLEIWHATGIPGGTKNTVVTMNSGSAEVSGAIAEFNGVGSLMAGSAQTATGTSASCTTPTIAGVPKGALVVIAMSATGGGATGSVPSGWTDLMSGDFSSESIDMMYQITSSAGSISATWTLDASNSWVAAIAVYLPFGPVAGTQRRKLGLPLRRTRAVAPVLTQSAVVANPTLPLAGSQVRRLRGMIPRRGRTFTVPSSQPTIVQQASFSTGGSPSTGPLAFSLPVHSGAGNMLVLGLTVFSSTLNTVTDTAGNTWQKAASIINSGDTNADVEVWYALNVAGGSNTVTLTWTGSIYIRGVIIEVTNVAGIQLLAVTPEISSSANPEIGPTATAPASFGFAFNRIPNGSNGYSTNWAPTVVPYNGSTAYAGAYSALLGATSADVIWSSAAGTSTTVMALFGPATPPIPQTAQPRRTRVTSAHPRRTLTTPVPAQVNPPLVQRTSSQARRVRGIPFRRGRSFEPPAPIGNVPNPPYPVSVGPMRRAYRGVPFRRGKSFEVVAPQSNPPLVQRTSSRVRGVPFRRGRVVQPLGGHGETAPFLAQMDQPHRLRGIKVSRGHRFDPPLSYATVINPTLPLSNSLRRAYRGLPARRGREVSVVVSLPAIRVVQTAYTAGGSSPESVLQTINWTTGNWLIGAFQATSGQISTVTGGGIWGPDVVSLNAGEDAEIWHAPYITGGAKDNTIYDTVGGSADIAGAVMEVNGVNSLMTAVSNSGTSAAPATATINNVPAGALVVVTANSNSGGTSTPSGFTEMMPGQWAGNGIDAGYMITTSAGSVSATWATSGSASWETAIAVYLMNPPMPYPYSEARRVRGIPFRRGRSFEPPAPIGNVPNPPYPVSVGPMRRAYRGVPFRRGKSFEVVAPQSNPPIVFTATAQHRRGKALPFRRGHIVSLVPAQLNPPIIPPTISQPHRARGLKLRRGYFSPFIQAQQTMAPVVTFGPMVNTGSYVDGIDTEAMRLPLTGITSGQPIIIFLYGVYSSYPTPTFSDSFSTGYTYTQVDQGTNSTNAVDTRVFIATGGSGTSGTITINAQDTGGYWAAAAIPCIGASVAVGMNAIDQHGNVSSGTGTTLTMPTLTPSGFGDGALYSVGTDNSSPITSTPVNPWTSEAEWVDQIGTAYYSNPLMGAPITTTYGSVGSNNFASVGVLVLPYIGPVWVPSAPRLNRSLPKFVARRGRSFETIHPQINPPLVPTSVNAPHRLRGAYVRRGHAVAPIVPEEIIPDRTSLNHRVRVLPFRRGKRFETIQVQQNPIMPPAAVSQPHRVRGALARRGRIAPLVPAQVNPPWPVSTGLGAERRLLTSIPARRGRLTTPIVAQEVLSTETVPNRRGRPLPFRRGRSFEIVPAQVNPPPAPATVAQPHRIRGALARRGRITPFVPSQINPPWPVSVSQGAERRYLKGAKTIRPHAVTPVIPQEVLTTETAPNRRGRPVPFRRGRSFEIVPAQQNPPLVPVGPNQPHRLRGALARRGKITPVVPAQVNPPLPVVSTLSAERHIVKGIPSRRGRFSTPVIPQEAISIETAPNRRGRPVPFRRGRSFEIIPAQMNPPLVPAGPNQPHRLRGALARRGRITPVVPAQVNPPLVPAGPNANRHLRGIKIPRAHVSTPVPSQDLILSPVETNRRVRPVPFRRGKSVSIVPAQANPPLPPVTVAQPHRLRGALARRGRITPVVPAQINPPLVPQEIAQSRRLRGALIRRGHRFDVTPPQEVPQAQSQIQAHRTRIVPAIKRARLASVVPQADGPVTPVSRRQQRIVPAKITRRSDTVPAQVVFFNHPINYPGNMRRAIRGWRLARPHAWTYVFPGAKVYGYPGLASVTFSSPGAAISASSPVGSVVFTGPSGTISNSPDGAASVVQTAPSAEIVSTN